MSIRTYYCVDDETTRLHVPTSKQNMCTRPFFQLNWIFPFLTFRLCFVMFFRYFSTLFRNFLKYTGDDGGLKTLTCYGFGDKSLSSVYCPRDGSAIGRPDDSMSRIAGWGAKNQSDNTGGKKTAHQLKNIKTTDSYFPSFSVLTFHFPCRPTSSTCWSRQCLPLVWGCNKRAAFSQLQGRRVPS